MKILRIILLVLIVLIIIVVAGGYYFLTHLDLNKLKPQIISAVNTSLRRDFDFKNAQLKISIKEGVVFNANQVTLGDDKRFSESSFLSVDHIYFNLDLLSLILKRSVSVANVTVNNPVITLIKNKSGALNAQSLGENPPKQNFEASSKDIAAENRNKKAAALPAILIKNIQINKGAIAYIDQSVEPNQKVNINEFNATLDNLSLVKPFTFSLDAHLFSNQKTLTAGGQISVDLSTNSVSLTKANLQLDLSAIPLAEIKQLLPLPATTPFPEKLTGTLDIQIDQLKAGAQGLTEINISPAIKGGSILVKNVSPGVNLDLPYLDVKISNFDLKNPFKLALKVAYLCPTPNISLDALISYDLKKYTVGISQGTFEADLKAFFKENLKSNLPLPENIPLPEEIAGILKVNLNEVLIGLKGLNKAELDLWLSNGKITFNQLAPGIGLKLSNFDFEIKDFSLDHDFKFKLNAAYLKNEPNIHAQGNAAYNFKTQAITLKATDISFDLDQLDLNELKTAIAALKDVPLPTQLEGKTEIKINNLNASASGLAEVDITGAVSKGKISLKELNAPIDQLSADFNLKGTALNLDSFALNLGSGRVSGQASLKEYLTTQNYEGKINLDKLDITEVINQKDLPVKIQGLLNGNINFSGQGFDPEKMMNMLQAKNEFKMTNCLLKDINVLKLALSQLSMVPNLLERIEANLPEQYKETLIQTDTPIKDITLISELNDGAIEISSFDLTSDTFIIKADGQVGLDQSYQLTGAFMIPAELTAALAEGVEELKYILDQDNQIQFPVTITGKASNFKITPDMEFLTKRIFVNRGKQELQKVFEKYINKGEETPIQTQTTTPAQPQEPTQEKVISDILNKIFK